MKRRPKNALLAALFSLALAPGARAALPDEIKVFADGLNEPGEWTVELHVNTTPKGRREPEFPGEVTPHHALRLTPEITRGLTKTLEVGVHLPTVRAADGRWLFGGPKLRFNWLPLQAGEKGGWFAGTNWEYSWFTRNMEAETRLLELRPILGWRNEDWLVSANPILDWVLKGPERGGRPAFNPAFKVSRAVAKDVALGLEHYSELGRLGRPLARGERAHTLFFVLDWDRGPLPFNLGIGRGNSAADRWTVKAIFEFSFH